MIELLAASVLVAFGTGMMLGRKRPAPPPAAPAPPPAPPGAPAAVAAPRVVRAMPRRVAAPRHVGVAPPTTFVLQNDVNFNGVRIKAGKLISSAQYDLTKLRTAGAKLAAAGDPGVEARAAEVREFQLKGHDGPDMDVTSRFNSVDDPSDGDGVSNPMTEDLDAGGFGILDLAALDFDEFDDGDSGAAATIDWSVANKQTIVLTADAVLTFVPPAGTANLMLHVRQDGVGARVPSWDPAISWTGAAGPPTLTTTPGGEDLIAFLWRKRALRFYGVMSPNFA